MKAGINEAVVAASVGLPALCLVALIASQKLLHRYGREVTASQGIFAPGPFGWTIHFATGLLVTATALAVAVAIFDRTSIFLGAIAGVAGSASAIALTPPHSEVAPAPEEMAPRSAITTSVALHTLYGGVLALAYTLGA